MARLIATLRIEENPHGDLLWIDLAEDDGVVFHSSALRPGITRDSAQRMVESMNNPEAVFVVDNMPSIYGQRIQRRIRIQ